MDFLLPILRSIVFLLVAIFLLNLSIYVHELGHYWAARWRKMVVDRFQIWFGKPIWKKEKDGVQFSLGWIPAGGFVALPQMAAMESIEGDNRESDRPLPKAPPIDRIIVAFAGPLFSFLLAVVIACVVWLIGKPMDMLHTTTIGEVVKGEAADVAGLKRGDKILSINDEPMTVWSGNLDAVDTSIMLSEGDKIKFTVQRPGTTEPLTILTEFKIDKSSFWQRRPMRQVGIHPETTSIVAECMPNSPAAELGLKEGDRIIEANGVKIDKSWQFKNVVEASDGKSVETKIERKTGEKTEIVAVSLMPKVPRITKDGLPKIGIYWTSKDFDTSIVHVNPIDQFKNGVKTMKVTIMKVISPSSSVGLQHLAGPVGIVRSQMQILDTPDGWRRVLAFFVFLNINLGIMNLLPVPVLDGGHIVTSLLEQVRGRPIRAKIMEKVQTAFALLLMSFMLYVTSKDLGGLFEDKVKAPPAIPEQF